MSDEEQAESPVDSDGPVDEEKDEEEAGSAVDAEAPATEKAGGRTFSLYGIASAVLAMVSVAVIVFGFFTWSAHHHEVDDRAYQNHVLRTAANWTGLLVNLNAATVDAGMTRLRGKTVGQLNAEFDATMQPYRAVIQKIKSRNAGRVESVSIESVLHHDFPAGAEAPAPPLQPAPSGATRTDTVMVVATSTIDNPEGKPETVRWNLQLGVSDVGGTPLISGLRPLR